MGTTRAGTSGSLIMSASADNFSAARSEATMSKFMVGNRSATCAHSLIIRSVEVSHSCVCCGRFSKRTVNRS
eukprot:scaffold13947_cov108-Isochrysis_galbana.AAC.11